MTAARSAGRDDVVVAALAAALTLPLWLARFPVAQDLPAHVETAAQIRALVVGDAALRDTYVLHALPWPNALPTFFLAPLLAVVDGVVAAKIVVAVGLFLWPVSLAVFFRRLGRPALLAALALPTGFDLSFSYGFLHFVVGKPLWVLTLIAAVDVARTPRAWRAFVLAGCLAALFCTHLMLFATAAPLCAVLVVVLGARWSTRMVGGAGLVAGLLPGAWWWAAAQPSTTAGGAYAFRSLRETASLLWQNLGDLHPGVVDVVPWALCLVGLVWVAFDAAPQRSMTRETLALGAVVVAVGAFALLGPVRTPHVSVVAERFTSMAAGLAVGVPPRLPSLRARRVVFFMAVVAVAVAVVDVTRHWRAFDDDDMGDFDALLAHVPAGSRVATHYVTPFSAHGNHNAAWHWPKLVALRGSSTDDSFAWRSTCVVGLRAEVQPPRHPRLVDGELASWDYLLVRGASAPVDRTLARLALVLVMQTGSWRLYRVEHANVDAVDDITAPTTRNPTPPELEAPAGS